MTPRLREVLPRDGFQDHPRQIPTAVKSGVIATLHAAGCDWIEVTSFVHPEQLPQFADAEEVVAAARTLPDVALAAFVPNQRGLDRALAAGVDEVSLAVATTDELARSNFRRDADTHLAGVLATARAGLDAGVDVSVTIGGSLGCPFEGHVPIDRVVAMATAIREAGVPTVLVADTTGMGTPVQVHALVAALAARLPDTALGVHIHGPHGVDAVRAAVDAGASVVDTSLGGFGGCPFVPDAPGNVDTLAIWSALHPQGEATGRRAALADAAARVTGLLGAVS